MKRAQKSSFGSSVSSRSPLCTIFTGPKPGARASGGNMPHTTCCKLSKALGNGEERKKTVEGFDSTEGRSERFVMYCFRRSWPSCTMDLRPRSVNSPWLLPKVSCQRSKGHGNVGAHQRLEFSLALSGPSSLRTFSITRFQGSVVGCGPSFLLVWILASMWRSPEQRGQSYRST